MDTLLTAWRATTPEDLLTNPLAGSAGQPHHFTSLLHKLHRRLPITIASIGSSIVSSYGGCTHPSAIHRDCLANSSSAHGWARDFFDQFNSTYPHPENRLLNLGVNGASIVPEYLACPNTVGLGPTDANPPDVVIFDPLTTEDTGQATYERFVRSLLTKHRSPPVLILLEFFFPFAHAATATFDVFDSRRADLKASPQPSLALRVGDGTRAASCACGGHDVQQSAEAKDAACTLADVTSKTR